MSSIEFIIDALPVPASRPKVARFGVYYPKAHTVYKGLLEEKLKVSPALAAGERLVYARMLFVMPPYKTSSFPTHRSDLDNLSKLPMDCMTDISIGEMKDDIEENIKKYWADDCLVTALELYKRFAAEGEDPHTHVKLEILEGGPEDLIQERFHG